MTPEDQKLTKRLGQRATSMLASPPFENATPVERSLLTEAAARISALSEEVEAGLERTSAAVEDFNAMLARAKAAEAKVKVLTDALERIRDHRFFVVDLANPSRDVAGTLQGIAACALETNNG